MSESNYKHLINNASDCALECRQGYQWANGFVSLEEFPNVVTFKDYTNYFSANSNRVALISGGGSGHEPAHLAYLGPGMLTAAVCGNLFASPSTTAILAAIRFCNSITKGGVLLIVKNYTGDRLNFGLATKRAQLEGIQVEWILVDDDVALLGDTKLTKDSSVGKRGLCGTVFVHKLAGAMAERGKSLGEIKATLSAILEAQLLRTIGVSLTGSVPMPTDQSSENKNTSSSGHDDLIEIGLGIHGEAGRKKINLMKSSQLVKLVLDDYLLSNSKEQETTHTNICLMVNNLGGLSNLELHIFANDCVKYLKHSRPWLEIRRFYCGTFMTSLNMNGFSVTVLELEQTSHLLDLLDAKTEAPAWPHVCGVDLTTIAHVKTVTSAIEKKADDNGQQYIKLEGDYECGLSNALRNTLKITCEDLIQFRNYLNELDTSCGDGDCGSSLTCICNVILRELNSFNFERPHQVFCRISEIFENGGGTICIIMALLFSASAQAFSKESKTCGDTLVNKQKGWLMIWYSALTKGIHALQEYGKAKAGQRSLLDPLLAVESYLKNYVDKEMEKVEFVMDVEKILKNLVNISYNTAQETAKMVPRVGRASYVDASLINTPDAGAVAISSIFSSIYKCYLME